MKGLLFAICMFTFCAGSTCVTQLRDILHNDIKTFDVKYQIELARAVPDPPFLNRTLPEEVFTSIISLLRSHASTRGQRGFYVDLVHRDLRKTEFWAQIARWWTEIGNQNSVRDSWQNVTRLEWRTERSRKFGKLIHAFVTQWNSRYDGVHMVYQDKQLCVTW